MSNNSLPITVQTALDHEGVTDYIQLLLAAHRSKQSAVSEDGLPAETKTWASSFVAEETVAGLEAAVRAITDLTSKLEVVEIISAAPLSDQTRQHIVAWLRQEVQPMLIIRPLVRRNLIGGIQVRTSRRAYDLSVVGAMQQSRETLTELVHAWN